MTTENERPERIDLSKYENVAADSEWVEDAACADMNIKDFFQSANLPTVPLKVALTCSRCPVRYQCLEAAAGLEKAEEKVGMPLTTRIVGHGIYAGLLPAQRATIWGLEQKHWAQAADALLERNIDGSVNRRKRDIKRGDETRRMRNNTTCFCGEPTYLGVASMCGEHMVTAIKETTNEKRGKRK